MPIIFNNRYKLTSRITKTERADIYNGLDLNNQRRVVIKLENEDNAHKDYLREHDFYAKSKHLSGIAEIYWAGKRNAYHVLVMEQLGLSLEEHFNNCQRRFSLKTVLLLGIQLLDRLESIHANGYIYGNMRPQECLMGLGVNRHNVYLIDFGFVKSNNLDQNPVEQLKLDSNIADLQGPVLYRSRRSHFNKIQNQRDDLESLGLMLVHFLQGTLPWELLALQNALLNYDEITKMKTNTTSKELCDGLPVEFDKYFNYLREMKIDYDFPDYSDLRRLFRELLTRIRKNITVLDWIVIEQNETEKEKENKKQLEKSKRNIENFISNSNSSKLNY